MDAAVNFIAFATDSRVILWTLFAYGLGGVTGMYLEAWRITIDRERNAKRLSDATLAELERANTRGWAADEEEPTVTAARRVA